MIWLSRVKIKILEMCHVFGDFASKAYPQEIQKLWQCKRIHADVQLSGFSTVTLLSKFYRQNFTYSPLQLPTGSSFAKSLETTSLWMSKVGINCSMAHSLQYFLPRTRRSERVPTADRIQEMIRCHLSTNSVYQGVMGSKKKNPSNFKAFQTAFGVFFFRLTGQPAKPSLGIKNITRMDLSSYRTVI